MLLANQEGAQDVLIYRVDPNDGRLTRMQIAAVGGSPTFTRAIMLP